MPPVVIDLKNTDDPNDAIHLAVEYLAAGKIIVIPTETVYGIAASALSESAAERLREIKKRAPQQPFSLAVKSNQDALDYVPDLSGLGWRLAKRCWPGPLTLVVNGTHPDSLLTQLPERVREMVLKDGHVGLRVPDHRVFHRVTRLSVGPLLLTSANPPGEPECVDGQDAAEKLGDQVDLILDDGPAKLGIASTVIRIEGNRYQILREGVLDESELREKSNFVALMVCTGNTCRSPLAEVLFKKRLADKLNCSIDELKDRGVIVASAGVAAMPGAGASAESVEVAKKMGLDLSGHRSQPVSDQLLNSADLILTMTNGHRQALVAHWPEIADRTFVLSRDGSDISDPIGGPLSLYEKCAQQIDSNLSEWANEIELGIPE